MFATDREICAIQGSFDIAQHSIHSQPQYGKYWKFSVIDGKAERMIDAGEVNQELFKRLKQYAKDKAALTISDIVVDSIKINSNEEDKCVH